MHRVTGALAVVVIVALQPFGLAAWAGTAEMQVKHNVPYADTKNPKQTLDVYRPAEGQDRPIVFWIHGGGWMQGDKADVKLKPQLFVDRGMVFVSTNYRVFPDVSIQTIAADVAQALAWTHKHARELGGDPGDPGDGALGGRSVGRAGLDRRTLPEGRGPAAVDRQRLRPGRWRHVRRTAADCHRRASPGGPLQVEIRQQLRARPICRRPCTWPGAREFLPS